MLDVVNGAALKGRSSLAAGYAAKCVRGDEQILQERLECRCRQLALANRRSEMLQHFHCVDAELRLQNPETVIMKNASAPSATMKTRRLAGAVVAGGTGCTPGMMGDWKWMSMTE